MRSSCMAATATSSSVSTTGSTTTTTPATMEGNVALLRLLTINDVYSVLPIDGLGGLAEFSTLLNRYRKDEDLKIRFDQEGGDHQTEVTARAPPSLFYLSGDFLSGSALAERFKGEHMIKIMNQLKTDAVVVGNHEFDFGVEVLHQRIAESEFPYFGANVIDRSTNQLLQGLHSHQVVEVALPVYSAEGLTSITTNVRIGLFGICTEATPFLSYPGDTIRFEPAIEYAKKEVKALQAEGVDLIVCLSHLSIQEDIQLAQEAPEINVILGGHDHHVCATMEGQTLVLKCGQNAYWLGVVDLFLELNPSTLQKRLSTSLPVSPTAPVAEGQEIDSEDSLSLVKRLLIDHQVIPVKDVEPDPSVAEVVQHYLKLNEEIERKQAEAEHLDMEELITTIEGNTLDTRSSTNRFREGSGGNMVADAMRFRFSHYEAEGRTLLAVINGGHVRGDRTYPPGTPIHRRDIQAELPFPRSIVVVLMQVKYLIAALETMLSKSVPNGSGAFPHLSSNGRLKYRVEPETNKATVVSLEVNGKLLQPEDMQSVAITEFMEMGGDEIAAWRSSSRLPPPATATDKTASLRTEGCLLAFLRHHSKGYQPVEEGRITLLTD